jgi:hypothetical protein
MVVSVILMAAKWMVMASVHRSCKLWEWEYARGFPRRLGALIMLLILQIHSFNGGNQRYAIIESLQFDLDAVED